MVPVQNVSSMPSPHYPDPYWQNPTVPSSPPPPISGPSFIRTISQLQQQQQQQLQQQQLPQLPTSTPNPQFSRGGPDPGPSLLSPQQPQPIGMIQPQWQPQHALLQQQQQQTQANLKLVAQTIDKLKSESERNSQETRDEQQKQRLEQQLRVLTQEHTQLSETVKAELAYIKSAEDRPAGLFGQVRRLQRGEHPTPPSEHRDNRFIVARRQPLPESPPPVSSPSPRARHEVQGIITDLNRSNLDFVFKAIKLVGDLKEPFRTGDTITHINGNELHMNSQDERSTNINKFNELVRGAPYTQVTFTVKNNSGGYPRPPLERTVVVTLKPPPPSSGEPTALSRQQKRHKGGFGGKKKTIRRKKHVSRRRSNKKKYTKKRKIMVGGVYPEGWGDMIPEEKVITALDNWDNFDEDEKIGFIRNIPNDINLAKQLVRFIHPKNSDAVKHAIRTRWSSHNVAAASSNPPEFLRSAPPPTPLQTREAVVPFQPVRHPQPVASQQSNVSPGFSRSPSVGTVVAPSAMTITEPRGAAPPLSTVTKEPPRNDTGIGVGPLSTTPRVEQPKSMRQLPPPQTHDMAPYTQQSPPSEMSRAPQQHNQPVRGVGDVIAAAAEQKAAENTRRLLLCACDRNPTKSSSQDKSSTAVV
jgi:hypothetical protein